MAVAAVVVVAAVAVVAEAAEVAEAAMPRVGVVAVLGRRHTLLPHQSPGSPRARPRALMSPDMVHLAANDGAGGGDRSSFRLGNFAAMSYC